MKRFSFVRTRLTTLSSRAVQEPSRNANTDMVSRTKQSKETPVTERQREKLALKRGKPKTQVASTGHMSGHKDHLAGL